MKNFKKAIRVSMVVMSTVASNVFARSTDTTENQSYEDSSLLAPKGKDCLIECENGGICEFVSEEIKDLRHISQSGGLIQRCRCPPGWGGITCEIPTETCDLRTKTCEFSGRPCDKVGNQWTCHCNIAENIDRNFAAPVCRRGITEYCSDYYDPEGLLYFCANGGKCVSDFLSAREKPGDLSVRRKYMDAGCVCNENFEGSRCEKLKFRKEDLIGFIDPSRMEFLDYDETRDSYSESKLDDSSSESSDFDPSDPAILSAMIISSLVVLIVVVAFVFFVHRRMQKRRQRIMKNAFVPDDEELHVERNITEGAIVVEEKDDEEPRVEKYVEAEAETEGAISMDVESTYLSHRTTAVNKALDHIYLEDPDEKDVSQAGDLLGEIGYHHREDSSQSSSPQQIYQ